MTFHSQPACRLRRTSFSLLSLALLAVLAAAPAAAQLDESCVISVLNRTSRANDQGSWAIPNAPANMGRVRARATCLVNGQTVSGESDFFVIVPDGEVEVPDIILGGTSPTPESVTIPAVPVLTSVGETYQLAVTANFAGGATADVSAAETGTTYTVSNPAVMTITDGGQLTALVSGRVVISALNEGALGLVVVDAVLSGDTDADGLPDDLEIANGLNPNDPIDALEDFDGDGLDNRQELIDFGTDIRLADTDGDGLTDGDEVNNVGTNPVLFDTDGDGFSDGLEVQLGTDPLDPDDFDLAGGLAGIEVSPETFDLTFNTVLSEASAQLTVTGQLIDGGSIDVTSTLLGTAYVSSDLSVCSFGADDGRIFAGVAGSCTIGITNNGFVAQATGTVTTFSPTRLGEVTMPGFTHNVDVAGDVAFVAAGSAGLQVVDAGDRSSPVVAGSIDTPGNAQDVVVRGNMAYVADGSSGLRLYDVSAPFSPVLLGVADTPGDARDVDVEGTVAYVADGSQGLKVIDVSNPASPAIVGSIGTLGSLGTFRGVDADPETGLLAAAAGSRLRVIDVSVPASPQLLGSAVVSDARDVVLRGDFAHVADFALSLTAVDLSDPSAPVVTASTPRVNGGLLEDVVRVGDLTFGADVFFVNGVPITNVGVPAAPVPVAILDFSPFGDDNGTGIAADGQFVYLTTNRSTLMIGQYLAIQDQEGVPPAVEITDPIEGDTLIAGDVMPVSVTATDDVAVEVVELLLDGTGAGTDFGKPYSFALSVPVGATQVTLGARATDYGDNVGLAEELVLTVLPDTDAPVITGVTPAAGTPFTSGDPMTLSAEVTDNVSVTAVTFTVGDRTFVDAGAPYSVEIATPPVFDPANVEIRVEAVDPSANVGSAVLTVAVDPLADLEPPAPRFLSPGDGDAVEPGVPVAVNIQITDNAFIDGYTLSVDGEVIGSEFLIGQSVFTDAVTLTPPADAQPGDSFTVVLEASDFGRNTATSTATLVIPIGTPQTGNQTLDSSFDGQDLLLGAGTFTVVEPLDLNSLTLLSGAVVVGSSGQPLSIAAAGRIQIGAGSTISMNGRGFLGGRSGHTSGDAPDGVTGSTPDAGGSHGGFGRRWDAGAAGETYDSVYLPHEAGGGGARDHDGSGDGRPGGGVIDLMAAEILVNGAVTTRGVDSNDAGRAAGAGGAVLLRASGLFKGIGSINVSGGFARSCSGSRNVGSGGGGRIGIHAGQLSEFDAGSQTNTRGGARQACNGSVLNYAGPGTVYLHDQTSAFGRLLLDSGEDSGNDRTGPASALPALGSGAVTLVETAGADAWVSAVEPFLGRWAGAFMTLSGGTGDALGIFRVLEIDAIGRALLEGAGAVAGVADYSGEYFFDRVDLRNSAGVTASDPIDGGDVVVGRGTSRLPNAFDAETLTLDPNAVAQVSSGSELRAAVRGRVTISAGARVDLSGRGFGGGNSSDPNGRAPAGVAGSTPDAGGSHGGFGTRWDAGGPGEVFDSVYLPQLSGGGGARDHDGSGDGRPGGGLIDITAAELVLDGELRSKGTDSNDAGRAAGAGGAVTLQAGTMSGGGLIDVSGGFSRSCSGSRNVGSGGGGRVAIHVGSFTGFDPDTSIMAWGGARQACNGSVAQYAGPGTVVISEATSTFGRLIVDSGETSGGADRVGSSTELPELGEGAVAGVEIAGADAWIAGPAAFMTRMLGAYMSLSDAAGGDLGLFRVLEIGADGRVLLEGAGAVTGAADYRGEYRFDRVDLRNGAGLVARDDLAGGDVEVGAGNAKLPNDFTADSLTLKSGAVVRLTEGSTMSGRINGLLEIEAGALLDVSGRGFGSGGAPGDVTPSTPDAGGSHGGFGVRWDAGAPGEVFDSVYVPQLSGGGGALDHDGSGSGRPGGGVIDLVAGDLILDGEIRSKGTDSNDAGRAAGAGGTVLIQTGTMSGGGLIDASGGFSRSCSGSRNVGAGGGGRVAVYVDQLTGFDADGRIRTFGGSRQQCNGGVLNYAGPGTVFISDETSTYGRLFIDSGEESNGTDRVGPSTQLPALGTGAVSAVEIAGADAWVSAPEPFQTRFFGAFMGLEDAAGADLGSFRVLQVAADGRALLEGAAGVTGVAAYSGEYRFDRLNLRHGAGLVMRDALTVTDVEVEAGAAKLPNDFSAGTLTLRSGAITRLTEGSTLTADVSGLVTIESGARLDLSDRGFGSGGAPAWVAASTPDAGGSHGGVGVRYDAGTPGPVYDSVYFPQLAGAGGALDHDGSGSGRNGGGALDLTAGQLVLDGEIRVKGSDSNDLGRAGGAGGSVLITAGIVSGGGLIDVSGGFSRSCSGSRNVGAGGGGRVSLQVSAFDDFDPALRARSWGGARQACNGSVLNYAGPGTIYARDGGSTFGRLIVDSGESGGVDRVGPDTPLPALGEDAVVALDVSGADAWLDATADFTIRWLGARAVLLDASDAELGAFTVIALDESGRALLEGAGAVAGAGQAEHYRGKYDFDQIDLLNGARLDTGDDLMGGDLEIGPGSAQLPGSFTLGNLTLRSGAIVTVASGSTIRGTVSGQMVVEPGALLDVTGRGFAGGTGGSPTGGAPAGIAGASPDAGGSHGGFGTLWDSGPVGEVFDSLYVPQHSGGGGALDHDGSGNGRNGGGLIDLAIGTLILDGEIRAKGSDSNDSGNAAGAGGSVLIDAAVMSGTGLIDASGGSSRSCSGSRNVGSGGGGRVALHVGDVSGFDADARVRAYGGARQQCNGGVINYAGPGTVYVADAGATYGRLFVDSGESGGVDRNGPSALAPELGTGNVVALDAAGADAWLSADAVLMTRFLGAWVRLFDSLGADAGAFRVLDLDAGGQTLLEGAAGVADAATFSGEYRFDRVNLRNSAGLVVRDPLDAGDVVVEAGNAELPNVFDASSVTLETGAVARLTEGSELRATVAGAVTIAAGARLDLTSRGFGGGNSSDPNGRAPAGVAGSTPDAGGSHGGRGIRWDAGTGGAMFDSVYLPQLSGGGGARDHDGSGNGLPGGGMIDIQATTLVLEGEIRTKGGDSNDAGRPAGAGGTVLVQVDTLSGAGLIDVSGGFSRSCSGSRNVGAGGGGRVSLVVDSLVGFDPETRALVRGGARQSCSGSTAAIAGPGTVYVADSAATFGDLFVIQGGNGSFTLPQTALPSIGTGTVGTATVDAGDPTALWIEPLDPGTLFDLGAVGMAVRINAIDYRVLAQTTDFRQLLLEGAAGVVNAGDAYEGVYRFDTVTVGGRATLVFDDEPDVGVFDVESGSTVIDNSP